MKEGTEWKVLFICLVLMIFLVIIMIVSVYTAEGAEIHGYLELGKAIENDWAVMEVQLELHHSIWIFDNICFGGWETWVIYGGKSNYPFKDIYNVGYRIGYKIFYAEIEHYCNHPVYSTYNADWWNVNQRSGNALTTVSIGVEW